MFSLACSYYSICMQLVVIKDIGIEKYRRDVYQYILTCILIYTHVFKFKFLVRLHGDH